MIEHPTWLAQTCINAIESYAHLKHGHGYALQLSVGDNIKAMVIPLEAYLIQLLN